jgi:hypothetical protein
MEGDAAYVGMELQILDNEVPIYKDLQPYQYHGSEVKFRNIRIKELKN